MKLKTKLVFSMVVLAALALISVSLFGYINTKNNIMDSTNYEMFATATSVSTEIDGWLNEKSKTVETTGIIVEATARGTNLSNKYLQAFEHDEQIYDIYIGFEKDGSILDGGSWVAPAGYDARERSWYIKAKETKEIGYSLTYADEANGYRNVLSASVPIYKGDNLYGVVAGDMELTEVSNIVSGIDIDITGSYAILIDEKGIILTHPDQDMLAHDLMDDAQLKDVATQMLSQTSGDIQYAYDDEDKYMVYTEVPSTKWRIGIIVPSKEITKKIDALGLGYIVFNLIAIVLIVIIILLIAKSIVKPVEALKAVSEKISLGDLTQTVEVSGQDEIAELGHSFNQMVENLRGLISHVSSASMDLSASSEEMAASAEQFSEMNTRIVNNVDVLVEDTNEEASNIQQATATVLEMAQGIQQIAESTESTNEAGHNARQSAETGKIIVDGAVQKMKDIQTMMSNLTSSTKVLGENSNEIGTIVNMIQSIAEQTNLLALNAAIEAARAGEQGRGFAVVADEVRKLAEESGKAANQIKTLIVGVQESTESALSLVESGEKTVSEGSDAVTQSGVIFDEIQSVILKITENIEEVSAATEEMSAGSDVIVSSMNNVSSLSENSLSSTTTISEAIKDQEHSISDIADSSGNLSELAQELQEKISEFKL